MRMLPSIIAASLRRFAALAVLLFCAAGAAAAAEPEDVSLTLEELSNKRYEVNGTFLVQASSAAVWDVLTDYENIPRFVSSMKRSRVLERRADGMVFLEQEAAGGMFMLTKKVFVCLEVRRGEQWLDFGDRCRRHFWFYEGGWRTRLGPDGTVVSYRLEVQPDFPAPGFLLRRVMRQGAAELLRQVRAEILRREGRALERVGEASADVGPRDPAL